MNPMLILAIAKAVQEGAPIGTVNGLLKACIDKFDQGAVNRILYWYGQVQEEFQPATREAIQSFKPSEVFKADFGIQFGSNELSQRLSLPAFIPDLSASQTALTTQHVDMVHFGPQAVCLENLIIEEFKQWLIQVSYKTPQDYPNLMREINKRMIFLDRLIEEQNGWDATFLSTLRGLWELLVVMENNILKVMPKARVIEETTREGQSMILMEGRSIIFSILKLILENISSAIRPTNHSWLHLSDSPVVQQLQQDFCGQLLLYVMSRSRLNAMVELKPLTRLYDLPSCGNDRGKALGLLAQQMVNFIREICFFDQYMGIRNEVGSADVGQWISRLQPDLLKNIPLMSRSFQELVGEMVDNLSTITGGAHPKAEGFLAWVKSWFGASTPDLVSGIKIEHAKQTLQYKLRKILSHVGLWIFDTNAEDIRRMRLIPRMEEMHRMTQEWVPMVQPGSIGMTDTPSTNSAQEMRSLTAGRTVTEIEVQRAVTDVLRSLGFFGSRAQAEGEPPAKRHEYDPSPT